MLVISYFNDSAEHYSLFFRHVIVFGKPFGEFLQVIDGYNTVVVHVQQFVDNTQF